MGNQSEYTMYYAFLCAQKRENSCWFERKNNKYLIFHFYIVRSVEHVLKHNNRLLCYIVLSPCKNIFGLNKKLCLSENFF